MAFKERCFDLLAVRKQLRFLFVFRLISFLLFIQQIFNVSRLWSQYSFVYSNGLEQGNYTFLLSCGDFGDDHGDGLVTEGKEMTRSIVSGLRSFLVILLLKFFQFNSIILMDTLSFAYTKS